jgi:ribonuclease HII
MDIVQMLKTRFKADLQIEAGVDEVGRGCLWGPLVTGAVIWLPEQEWTDEIREVSEQIKDSKKMTEKRRTKLAEFIKACALDYAIGIVEAKEIDDMGMTMANQTAFARAVEGLSVPPDRLLVDGTIPLLAQHWTGEQHTLIDGDAEYVPIAAASILAKVYRDTWVESWCAEHKEIATNYSLSSSKGYGTAAHRNGLLTHGVHALHRRLFLRKILGEQIYQPSHQYRLTD